MAAGPDRCNGHPVIEASEPKSLRAAKVRPCQTIPAAGAFEGGG